jgi:hypothetical protein
MLQMEMVGIRTLAIQAMAAGTAQVGMARTSQEPSVQFQTHLELSVSRRVQLCNTSEFWAHVAAQ